jgi:hypothetical protein
MNNSNKWKNSEISSLMLWHNEGLPNDEIARRLNKPVDIVNKMIHNKKPPHFLTRGNNNNTNRKKDMKSLVYHNVYYVDTIVFVTSIIRYSEEYHQARAWIATTDLLHYQNMQIAEFKTLDACHRWFEELQERVSF